MMSMNEIEALIKKAKEYGKLLEHNHTLFNIFEGDLLTYVQNDLKEQLSPKSYAVAKNRIVPINILRKIIDKQSVIYGSQVVREVVDGTEADQELLSWYEHEMRANFKMNQSNEALNLYKNTLIQPYVFKGKPALRFIPSDRFVAISNDPVNPTKPTHFVILDGKTESGKQIYSIYSDTEWVIIDEDKNILINKMLAFDNADGVNVFGRLPFVYANLSENLIMPLQDEDTLKMTKIIPILLSDLNYAVMFQAFSVMYGVDLDEKNLEMNPNAFWSFKSDPNNPSARPEVGVIKPQVEIDAVLNLITAELNMWLESKGLVTSQALNTDGQNAISGFSKALDHIDASSQTEKQVEIFKAVEAEMWDLIMHTMHPYWVSKMQIDQSAVFTNAAKVVVEFKDPTPLMDRTQLLADLKLELEAGFTSRKYALKKLYPEMSDQQIEEFMAEIDAERTIEIEEPADVEDDSVV
ncbi:MAG: phage portal protein [Spirochaetes bacterium]|nr:MAG: phage portal protein [Spirochaetota bacterium]